jgi:hypothetical protein
MHIIYPCMYIFNNDINKTLVLIVYFWITVDNDNNELSVPQFSSMWLVLPKISHSKGTLNVFQFNSKNILQLYVNTKYYTV